MNPILSKILIPVLSGGVATAAAVGGYQALHTDEGYRTIQVYELEGEAVVDRPSVGSIEAYVNMLLDSGDSAYTGNESYMYLNLDNEEYALLEPDSSMKLEATGDKESSRTKIYLDKGALTNRLDKPLGEKDSYEVTTPNSTMAVRGTEFRVVVVMDPDGTSHTELEVYEGVVEVRLLYPDGSEDEEAVSVQAGNHIRMWGTDVTSDYEYVGDMNQQGEAFDIEDGGQMAFGDAITYGQDGSPLLVYAAGYSHLSSTTVNFLLTSIREGGHVLTMSEQELEQVLKNAIDRENAARQGTTSEPNAEENSTDGVGTDETDTEETKNPEEEGTSSENGSGSAVTQGTQATAGNAADTANGTVTNATNNTANNSAANVNNSSNQNKNSSTNASDSNNASSGSSESNSNNSSSDSGSNNNNGGNSGNSGSSSSGNNGSNESDTSTSSGSAESLDPNAVGSNNQPMKNYYYNGELIMQAEGDVSGSIKMSSDGTWVPNENNYTWQE